MWTKIRFGIMIDMGVDVTNTPLGLYDGSFSWVSGSPDAGQDYIAVSGSGIPVNPITVTAQSLWKTDVLQADSMGSVILNVDLKKLGNYGEVSPMSFAILNTDLISDYLLTVFGNEVYKLPVRFYIISDDGGGTPYTFDQRWAGVIDSISYNDTKMVFQCVDASKLIHKPFVPRIYDKVTFPNIDPNIIGNAGVVSIGKVTYAHLVPIEQSATRQVTTIVSGVSYYTVKAAIFDGYLFGQTYFSIASVDKIFKTNELVGYVITCTDGGPNQSRKIISNSIPNSPSYPFAPDTSKTFITIDAPFTDSSGNPITQNSGNNFWASWWFEISSSGIAKSISENPIYEFTKTNGAETVTFWDSTANKFLDAWGVIQGFFKDGLTRYFPMPGVTLKTVSAENVTEPKSVNTSYVKITSIVLASKSVTAADGTSISAGDYTVTADSFPSASSSCPNLFDKDNSTGYHITTTINANLQGASPGIGFQYVFNIGVDLASLPEIASTLGIGFRVKFTPTGTLYNSAFIYSAKLSYTDIYGNAGFVIIPSTTAIIDDAVLANNFAWNAPNPITSSAAMTANFIGDKYFPALAGIVSQKQREGAPLLVFNLSDIKSLNKVSAFQLTLLMGGIQKNDGTDSGYSYDISLTEIALVKSYEAAINSSDLYAKIKGEKFQGTWGGRRTDGNPVTELPDAIEFIFRQYDNAAAYVDVASFDALPAYLSAYDLTVGRQEDKQQQSSAQIIDQLCAHGMLVLAPKKNGTKALINWTDKFGTDGFTFDEDSGVQYSLSDTMETPVYDCYSQFTLNYDLNPANGKYQNSCFIKKVDQNSFPAQFIPTGTQQTYSMSNATKGYRLLTDGTDRMLMLVFQSDIIPFVGQVFSIAAGHGGFTMDYKSAIRVIIGDPVFGNYAIVDTGATITALSVATTYQDGAMYYWLSQVLAWQEYVGGVTTYSYAKTMWDNAHAGYLITKTVAVFSMDLPWYPDLAADWGNSAPNFCGPQYLLLRLSYWLSRPRKIQSISVPINSSTIALEVGQSHYIQDQKRYPDARFCWIESITLDTKKKVFDISLIVDPYLSV